jgi:hypothetical protein
MIHGSGAEVLRAEYEEDFAAEFGHAPINVSAPAPRPKQQRFLLPPARAAPRTGSYIFSVLESS